MNQISSGAPGAGEKRKYLVLGSLFVAWIMSYTDRVAFTVAIIPISREFGLTTPQAGYLLSAFYAGYAVMQLGGGSLSDRFGGRVVLIGCVLAWSLFTSLTGGAWSLSSLLVLRFMFGMGEGGFSPASSVTIADNFKREERGRAKAFLLSTDYLGSAIGSGVIALFIMTYGWHTSYQYLGVVGALVAALLFWCLPPQTKRDASVAHDARAPARPTLLSLMKLPAVLKIFSIWFFTRMLWIGVVSWMPSYLIKSRGISLGELGFATILPYCLAFIFANIVGYGLDKLLAGYEKVLMTTGTLLAALSLFLCINSQSLAMTVVYWAGCMLAFNLVYVSLFSIPIKYFQEAVAGRVTGIMNFGGQLSGTIAPTLIGYWIAADKNSYVPAFLFLSVCGVVAAAIAMTWKGAKPEGLTWSQKKCGHGKIPG
ncbi:MFS transporter [Burkholderia pseudomallei]|uniref:MFS transporter n=1 Tax=Burkholderia pseudomallei TaxID=28450 RepID=UPI00050EC11B|nr:MFS transporter [Burkholderia pseudomallei]KGC41241.1 sugar (and other) transporter family protein [Burkholderia pseudomallei]KGV36236.1 sugar (and other) transporter family protein [Burkholderia pseudomallei MSHR4012]KGV54514.1 sugar (and other) transporter family protein [Burkholderia pseudomallei MSHR4003]KGW60493.1 sugar (and other) transporter family protein [Burkholderia pseudomallei MSHR1029]